MDAVEVWCRVSELGADGSVLGRWTFRGCSAPDLAAIDDVVRVLLEVRRRGGSVAISDVSAEFGDLLEFVGLRQLRGQVGGQAEGREEPGGFEERVEPADPAG
jgi:hypothetical protein